MVDYPCRCDDDDGTIECPQHVSCDIGCRAPDEPDTPEQWQAAAIHWRYHRYLAGCSHGC